MKRVLFKTTVLVSMVIFIACAFGCVSNRQAQTQDQNNRFHGASIIGAIGGAAAGALIDKDNRLRGGAIGALLGVLAGETLEKVSRRAAQEAARTNKQVKYKDGGKIVQATPAGYNPKTKCKIIINQVWEDGELISTNEQEICEN